MEETAWWIALKAMGVIAGTMTFVASTNRWVVKPIHRQVVRVRRALDTADRISDGNRMHQIAEALQMIETIAAELRPNGGASIRDQLDRIERDLRAEKSARRAMAHAFDIGLFETGAKGNCVWVNREFCEMTGLTERETDGTGWFNAIDITHRAEALEEWDDVVRRCRQFNMTLPLKHPKTGHIRYAQIEAWPAFEPSREVVQGYYGVVRVKQNLIKPGGLE